MLLQCKRQIILGCLVMRIDLQCFTEMQNGIIQISLICINYGQIIPSLYKIRLNNQDLSVM